MVSVESVRLRSADAASLPLSPQFCVLAPEILVVGPLVDQLRAFALPLWISLAIEKPIGEIVGTDYRHGAEPGHVHTGATEAENGTVKGAFTFRYLRRAVRRFVCLRIVHEHQVGADGLAVWPGVREATNPSGDAGDTNGRPGRR